MRYVFSSSLLLILLLCSGCATDSASHRKAATITTPAATTVPSPTTNADQAVILQAVKLMQSGHAQDVLNGPINQLIAKFEAMYPGAAGVTVFCAKTGADTLVYLATAATHLPLAASGKKQRIEVLDPTWAQAYWVRAYSYGELKRFDLETAELHKALQLSPRDSQYLNELAFAYLRQGQWQRALDTYKLAEGYASLSSPYVAATSCTSFRGEGYVLVEMSRFDEAQAAYHACLQLKPGDPHSLAELHYIHTLREKIEMTRH